MTHIGVSFALLEMGHLRGGWSPKGQSQKAQHSESHVEDSNVNVSLLTFPTIDWV